MEHHFLINPFKCIISTGTCLCFFLLSGCMVLIQRWGSTVIFLLFGLLFGLVAIINGSVIHLDSTGIFKTVLGIRTKILRWDDIGEVGVTGTKPFNKNHPEKTGGLYIYFSETPMTEQERFEMILKWPPTKKLYLTYNTRRAEAILLLYNRKLQTYNTGNLIL